MLGSWNRNSSIETVLVEIRRFVSRYLDGTYLHLILVLVAERWDHSATGSFPNHLKAVHFDDTDDTISADGHDLGLGCAYNKKSTDIT
jgi:hypothetical protein